MTLLGAQVRPWLQTWGPDGLAQRLGEVMTKVAEVGFAGFETNLRTLSATEPARFAEWSEAASGLRLCAAHTGGDWWGSPDLDTVVRQAAGLPGLGCEQLVVSGAQREEQPPADELARFADNLNRLADECRAVGVQVAYHNHARELAHDALILDAIDLPLAPDLGWVAYAGVDVPSFVRRFRDRIAYLHVRDVVDGGFTEVGRGKLDYAAIGAELGDYSGWWVAESELGERWRGLEDPDETVRAQYDGLAFLR